jgi:hypothetical protein
MVASNPALHARLTRAGLAATGQFTWEAIGPQWLAMYRQVANATTFECKSHERNNDPK